jgi:hypothetical protein
MAVDPGLRVAGERLAVALLLLVGCRLPLGQNQFVDAPEGRRSHRGCRHHVLRCDVDHEPRRDAVADQLVADQVRMDDPGARWVVVDHERRPDP